MMRALVTNDDGIDSDGLAALARAAVATGLDVVIAAPLEESSGTSASLTAARDGGSVVIQQRSLAGLDEVPTYAVAAHPGFIALAAVKDAFGRVPDVVLSGINRGANVGRAVLHSGTVGAALTGALHGARAMAVSLDAALAPQAPLHWETGELVARHLLPLLLEAPAGTTFNLNVPDRPADEIGDLQRARLARVGAVQSRFEQFEGGLRVTETAVSGEPEAGTDTAALARGHPSITELSPLREMARPSLPDRLALPRS
jgi:5'-nucleotidase